MGDFTDNEEDRLSYLSGDDPDVQMSDVPQSQSASVQPPKRSEVPQLQRMLSELERCAYLPPNSNLFHFVDEPELAAELLCCLLC